MSVEVPGKSCRIQNGWGYVQSSRGVCVAKRCGLLISDSISSHNLPTPAVAHADNVLSGLVAYTTNPLSNLCCWPGDLLPRTAATADSYSVEVPLSKLTIISATPQHHHVSTPFGTTKLETSQPPPPLCFNFNSPQCALTAADDPHPLSTAMHLNC